MPKFTRAGVRIVLRFGFSIIICQSLHGRAYGNAIWIQYIYQGLRGRAYRNVVCLQLGVLKRGWDKEGVLSRVVRLIAASIPMGPSELLRQRAAAQNEDDARSPVCLNIGALVSKQKIVQGTYRAPSSSCFCPVPLYPLLPQSVWSWSPTG